MRLKAYKPDFFFIFYTMYMYIKSTFFKCKYIKLMYLIDSLIIYWKNI